MVEERVPTGFIGKIIGRNFYNLRKPSEKPEGEANAGEWVRGTVTPGT